MGISFSARTEVFSVIKPFWPLSGSSGSEAAKGSFGSSILLIVIPVGRKDSLTIALCITSLPFFHRVPWLSSRSSDKEVFSSTKSTENAKLERASSSIVVGEGACAKRRKQTFK